MTQRALSIPTALFATILFASSAHAKEKITFATLLDPIYDSFVYPIKAGIIKSDLIDVEITSGSVPAVMQSMATKQYDVITVAAFAVPKAEEKGLKTTILSVAVRYRRDGAGADVWVKKDSPYKSIADLKGKSIAMSSSVSANTTLVRFVMAKEYRMNTALDGGDLQWLEIPTGAQLAALATGKVDSAILLHTQAIQALSSNVFRSILAAAQSFHKDTGTEAVTAVQVAYPERLTAKPEAYAEFNRMLKASRDYTLSHLDEVTKAMGGDKIPPTLLKDWLRDIGTFPAVVTDEDRKSIRLNWEVSRDLGLIHRVPDMNEVIWSRAIKSDK